MNNRTHLHLSADRGPALDIDQLADDRADGVLRANHEGIIRTARETAHAGPQQGDTSQ